MSSLTAHGAFDNPREVYRFAAKNARSIAAASRLADAAVDLGRVMAGRLTEEARSVVDRAALRVGRGVVEPADAGVGDARRRTSRRARASRRGRSRRAARSRSSAAASRIARISAWAVGSASSRVRLPARAMTTPSRARAAPIGASPRASAARASAKATLIGSSVSAASSDKGLPQFRPDFVGGFAGAARTLAFSFGGRAPSGLGQALAPGNPASAARRNETIMSDEAKPDRVREGSRIAKVMARAGLCSRREAEAWIAAGRVAVNGKVLESPAYNVTDEDDVRVDGQQARRARAHPALPVPQAPRARHHRARSRGAADHLRRPAAGPSARRGDRAARHQHRGPAAAHQRRRPRARAGAAFDRMAPPLPGARAWGCRAGAARRA